MVSLTMGNSRFPFGDGFAGHADGLGQLGLGHALCLPDGFDGCPGDVGVHGESLLCGFGAIVSEENGKGNLRFVGAEDTNTCDKENAR